MIVGLSCLKCVGKTKRILICVSLFLHYLVSHWSGVSSRSQTATTELSKICSQIIFLLSNVFFLTGIAES